MTRCNTFYISYNNQNMSDNPKPLFLQISQLCHTVLLFQQSIDPLREQLFTRYSLTDQHLWQAMFGSKLTQANKQNLHTFMHKNGSTVGMDQCGTFVRRYCEFGDAGIGGKEMWVVFQPKGLEMVQGIVRARKSRSVMPGNLEIDFRAKQLIVSVIEKTMQFESYAERMRQNIAKFAQEFEQFSLKSIQPKYLQAFLIDYLPEIRIKECQKILSHILGNHKNKQKQFYKYFLPQKIKKQQSNPIEKTVKQCGNKTNTLKLFNQSNKIWRYGQKYQGNNKPLYLI